MAVSNRGARASAAPQRVTRSRGVTERQLEDEVARFRADAPQPDSGVLRLIPTAQLQTSRIQPPERTTVSAMVELVLRIIQEGGLIVPLTVTPARDGFLVLDGHRRLAAARLLNIQQLHCFVIVRTGVAADIAFMNLNAAAKPFTGRTWLSMLERATISERPRVMRSMRSTTRARVESLMTYLTEPVFYSLLPEIQSPAIVDWMERLMSLFQDRDLTYTARGVARWVIERGDKYSIQMAFQATGANKSRLVRRLHEQYTSNAFSRPRRARRAACATQVADVH